MEFVKLVILFVKSAKGVQVIVCSVLILLEL